MATPVYKKLADKWIAKHRQLQSALFAKHGDVINDFVNNTRSLAISSASALMLLSSPATALIAPPHSLAVVEDKMPVSQEIFLVSDLNGVVPEEVRELTSEEEAKVSDVLTREFGFPVAAELEGIRLNRSYGLIGAEQHLARYPGDTMATHFESGVDTAKYYSSGMAPGLGAWGYFARTQGEMTQKDVEREKYYIATQTFLAPGFDENVRKYITFFKYRKMLIVNPQNGRAMVVVIGDAGPGATTGKHLGGSPEVMKYLERVDGKQRGPVLYYFIDDPEDKIPLGPIEPK